MQPPKTNTKYYIDLNEFMTVQYMPVHFPKLRLGFCFPENLVQVRDMTMDATFDFIDNVLAARLGKNIDPEEYFVDNYYVYLTAKCRYVKPEANLNRTGWHIDAFGQPEDANYVWCDAVPTLYVQGDIGEVPKDDVTSLEYFEEVVQEMEHKRVIPNTLYHFGHNVLHTTAPVLHPCVRQFVKISFSPYPYNLRGNAHNYLFNYNWYMYNRLETRNDPIRGLSKN